jgi:hypothetical protein
MLRSICINHPIGQLRAYHTISRSRYVALLSLGEDAVDGFMKCWVEDAQDQVKSPNITEYPKSSSSSTILKAL